MHPTIVKSAIAGFVSALLLCGTESAYASYRVDAYNSTVDQTLSVEHSDNIAPIAPLPLDSKNYVCHVDGVSDELTDVGTITCIVGASKVIRAHVWCVRGFCRSIYYTEFRWNPNG